MLEKLHLSDEKIQTCLNSSWGLNIQKLEFLPIGNDSSAWVYRIETENSRYFLKVRQGELMMSMLQAPRYLQQHGLNQIVAPIETNQGRLYAPIDDYWLILYPLVDGTSAWDLTLSDEQWTTWGDIIQQIHHTPISDELSKILPYETFISKWDAMFHQVNMLIQTKQLNDSIQQQMANFWKGKQPIIDHIYQRLMELSTQFQQQSHKFVICHADIHKANIMIDKQHQIRIVDWDEVIIAPKERDLMFFVEDGHEAHKVMAFMQGYGETEINQTMIAYYRYEWVVQEFGDFGERVFLSEELGDIQKQDSLDGFKQLFDAGDVIDLAIQADKTI